MSKFYDSLYKKDSMTAKALSLLPSFLLFRKWYRFLRKSQWLNRKQLEDYQIKKLQLLLTHCYEHVPYYRRILDELHLKPIDFQRLDDLQKLPFLTKEIIRNNIDTLKADNYSPEQFEYVTTSGTTAGVMGPLGFYYEKRISRVIEWAFMKTQWDRIGYKFWDKCVVFRGYTARSTPTKKHYQYSLFNRWLILSPFHLKEDTYVDYVNIIRKFNPKFIQSFPSEIMLLAKYMKTNNLEPFPNLKALLLGSENLYTFQRQFLEEFFHCRVYSWYGHSEQAVLAGECEYTPDYHIFPEYGIVELVNQLGEVITNPNDTGEIVATGLNNYIMPFIRYKTQDLGKISHELCKCGRNYSRIIDLQGRIQEMIVGKDGNLISLSVVVAAIRRLEGYPQIKKVQFIQEKKGEVLVKIVKGKGYSKEDEEEIIKGVQKKFGDILSLSIVYVKDIAPTALGKHRFLIQKLPVKYGDSYV